MIRRKKRNKTIKTSKVKIMVFSDGNNEHLKLFPVNLLRKCLGFKRGFLREKNTLIQKNDVQWYIFKDEKFDRLIWDNF